MRHITINTYRTARTAFHVQRDDVFEFRGDLNPRWHWLQRAAIWALKKLGAYAKEERIKYGRIHIDSEDVIASTHGQIDALLEDGRKPGLILMGFDQFNGLRHGMLGYLRFDLQCIVWDGGRPEYMGLPVYTVPHMHGVLVLPDKPDDVLRAASGQ
jgi:hypothetical protein